MPDPRKNIPPERKAAYYAGSLLIIVGGLCFLSTFVVVIANFGDVSDFEALGKSTAILAFGGVALMIFGVVIRNLGAAGLAGSGAVLDPQQARKDLEPYSRMAGGMLKDALCEADLAGKPTAPNAPAPPVVKVRCRACESLNDEDAQFCKKCGTKL